MLFQDSMHISAPYRRRLGECGLGSVEAVLQQVDGCIAAWSRTTDTLLVPSESGAPGFYLKRYRYPNWMKRIRGSFRGTLFGQHRGRAEYRLLDNMRSLGIDAVRPVAYGARRRAGFVEACFLITEEVPGSVNLTTFATEVRGGQRTLSTDVRREMAVRLAGQVARMHATGFSHGQLYWRNVLLRFDPTGQPEFFFLDARPRRGARMFGRGGDWWMNELAQIAASALPFATDREQLLFLHEYTRARGVSAVRLARLVRSIAPRWQRHEQQRIRMSERFAKWNRRLTSDALATAAGEASQS